MAKKSDSRTASVQHATEDGTMTPERFRAWRKRLGLKQKEAADHLGLKKRMIQYYERGHRDGHAVVIPKTVRLACYALASGVGDYDGAAVAPIAQPAPEASAAEAVSENAPAVADAGDLVVESAPAAAEPSDEAHRGDAQHAG